jgi:alcohol dehydrogenase
VLATSYDIGVKHHGGYAQYARAAGRLGREDAAGHDAVGGDGLRHRGIHGGPGIVRMEQVGLKPGNGPVIVSGATGGVGSIAIAALSKLGYHVVALTGKASRRA